LRFNIIHSTDF